MADIGGQGVVVVVGGLLRCHCFVMKQARPASATQNYIAEMISSLSEPDNKVPFEHGDTRAGVSRKEEN